MSSPQHRSPSHKRLHHPATCLTDRASRRLANTSHQPLALCVVARRTTSNKSALGHENLLRRWLVPEVSQPTMRRSSKTVRTAPSLASHHLHRSLTHSSCSPHHNQSLQTLIHHPLEQAQSQSVPTTTATNQDPPAISPRLYLRPQNTKQQRRRHPLQQPNRPPPDSNPSLGFDCDFNSAHRPSLPHQLC